MGWRCGRRIWGIGETDAELLLDLADESSGDEVGVHRVVEDTRDAQFALVAGHRHDGVGVVV